MSAARTPPPSPSASDERLLAGRRIVVTGAARGVGRDLARRFSSCGADLILADIDAAGVNLVAEEIRRAGRPAIAATVDLADPVSVAGFAAHVASLGEDIHGLVNNAAIATGVGGALLEDIPIDLWDRVMQVNVRGTWLVTKAFTGLLAVSGAGRIVNMASDTALWGAPRLLAYVASKGAILAMTKSMARELGPRGIGVTAVAPGIMRNEATDYVPQERHQLYETGRAAPGPQTPADIAGAVAFLLTPDAIALTGQTILVNAGFVFA